MPSAAGNHATGSTSAHVVSSTTSATCGTVSNTADVTASNDVVNTPTVANGHEASASEDVNCSASSITHRALHSFPTRRSSDLFTVTVTNSGSGVAKNVTVTDTLPTNAGTS